MKKNGLGYLLVSAPIAVIVMILVVPLFYTLFISFHNFDYIVLGAFTGLKNYTSVFRTSRITDSFIRSFVVTFAATAGAMFFGVLLSLWINTKYGRYAMFLQILSLIPWFTSMVVCSMTWRWIFNMDYGPLNYALRLFGRNPVKILESPKNALIALICIMCWRLIGYVMILVLSGLKALSFSMLEAAMIDGANDFQMLMRIKLPNIKSQIILAFIIISLATINNSTIPLAFNNGGPANATDVVALELYRLGFQHYSFGEACALSIMVLIINIVIIIFYMRSMNYANK